MRSRFDCLIGEKIPVDGYLATLSMVSTALIVSDFAYDFSAHVYWDRFFLYLIVPLLVITLLWRERPTSYGFTLGEWRVGLLFTSMSIVVLAPMLYTIATHDASIRGYYQSHDSGGVGGAFLDLVGWEFFCRGWLLFGYGRRFGSAAIWLQMVPFALAHLGKPPIEALLTVPGGVGFGWLAWRTRSFVWPFLIHWFILAFLVLMSTSPGR